MRSSEHVADHEIVEASINMLMIARWPVAVSFQCYVSAWCLDKNETALAHLTMQTMEPGLRLASSAAVLSKVATAATVGMGDDSLFEARS